MPSEEVLKRLDDIAARPMRGEAGYECPHHGPDRCCADCAPDDELLEALGIPAHPCGCLTFGEECPKCKTEPGKSRGPEAAGTCPIEVVFYPERIPCTFDRGHAGGHSWEGVTADAN